MALSLPSREQCENWDPTEVACFLSQNGMWECASTVSRMNMDGSWFLNITDIDLSRFSPIHRPQLQKMVQDIKKNDDSILNRLKRFQNEQAALIRKTGRSTLDRMKNKAPPRLPDRDYREDNGDGKISSGSDFDSDTYEDPQAENDDSYEPPPCERVFNPTSSMSVHREEYADRCSRRPSPAPRIAQRQSRPRPPIPPTRTQSEEDDEDYVEPEAATDDDYIEPSEKSLHPPVNRVMKPMRPHCVAPPDVYEVPDTNDDVSMSRSSSQLQPPSQRIPPRPSPRLHKRKPAPPPKPEPVDADDADEEYEICDGVEKMSVKTEKLAPTPPMPLPKTRKNLLAKPKPPSIPGTRDHEASLHGRPGPPEPRSRSPRRDFHLARFSVPQATENESRESEEKAGVLKKPWYTSTCDRKMAEKALLRANRDGAYLVRKSSGHDTQQPFTLVVFYNGHVYNIPIRFLPASQKYALGREKMGEEHFSSVSHIIENHQRNPLVLIDSQSNTKDSIKLLHPIQV
ncbi:B-cell linker protein isoform X2 [Alosa pseudoharengus]|uniref:B-cell linker protein isoform X2 n=1 Tax=Alosa pseudoharengus TaxID=34774 RepID=UPI003F8C5AAF